MTQRIFNIDNKQDVKDLFDLLPDWANWIAFNDGRPITAFSDEPVLNTYGIWENNTVECKRMYLLGLIIGSEENYKDRIIQRPLNRQDWIGKYGIFADEERELNLISGRLGVLGEVMPDSDYMFGRKMHSNETITAFRCFRLLTQEEKQQIMDN